MVRPVLLAFVVACAAPEHPRAVGSPGLRLPDGATPLGYDLRLELDPDRETFRGEVRIRVRLDAPSDRVWIHADELDITAARYGADQLAPAGTGDQMRAFGFGHVVEGTVTLAFEFTGRTTHDEEGLFRQRAGERWYLFSQAESVFARRITPCFDEPRWKTPWRVTLVVPREMVALGNAPELRATTLTDGRREVELAETPAMPSYLLAVAVGPFALVDAGTVGARHVPVHVAALAGDADRVGVVAAQLPKVVDAVEAYTGDPLPWPKLDLVAVPHLFGAMENPGLVTFDQAMLVGDPRRPAVIDRFVRVAAHEVVHQWFGNLVTPAWWDDLWLAEAFASWLGDKVTAQVGGFDDPALRLALAREQALEADDEPDARPLRRRIERNDDPDNSYDTIAYEKGQAVLATFEHWLGEARLRGALRGYLRDHRGGTATTADLVGALPTEVRPALISFLDHPGAPVVDLDVHCPVIVARARDARIVPICIGTACAIVGARTELACSSSTGRGDAGYYHLASSTPPTSPALVIAVADDVAAAIRRGEEHDPVRWIREFAASPEVASQHAAITVARAIDPIVDDAARSAWWRWLAARFGARVGAMLDATGPERELLDELVALIPADRLPAATVHRAAMMVDAGARDPAIVAIAAPEAGRALFDRLVAAAHAAHEPDLEPLGGFGPELAAVVVELAARGEFSVEVAWPAIAGYFDRAATRDAAWTAVRARLVQLSARMSGAQVADLIDATSSLCAHRDEIAAAFAPRIGGIIDGKRHLDHALGEIDRCIARRARAGDLAAALH